jgi:hypothetical protein
MKMHKIDREHPNGAIDINTRIVIRLPAIDVCSFHDVFTNVNTGKRQGLSAFESILTALNPLESLFPLS